MYKVRVVDQENRLYSCGEGEDLLTAARRHWLPMPTGCRSGGCGMCKIRVVEGDYTRGICSKAVLSDEERHQHYTLACKTYPRSDIRIVVDPTYKGA